MYVIKHNSSNTVFSIRLKCKEKTNVCIFPNNNHAKRVADNIVRFKYCQNKFPSPTNFENLFKHPDDLIYENDFTPFNSLSSLDDYGMIIEPVIDIEFLDYCQSANLDVVFCVLDEKSSDKDLIFMPIKGLLDNYTYLETCYSI